MMNRNPVRISLRGRTDLPSYYREHERVLVDAATANLCLVGLTCDMRTFFTQAQQSHHQSGFHRQGSTPPVHGDRSGLR
jgi:hypothetical protein